MTPQALQLLPDGVDAVSAGVMQQEDGVVPTQLLRFFWAPAKYIIVP